MRKLLSLAADNKIVTLWFGFLVLSTAAGMFVLNPILDPDRSVFSMPQLNLQFSYTSENGDAVLSSWGADASARYLDWIWIDLAWALSYGPFFAMLIWKLSGNRLWAAVPLVEMCLNLTETSLEMWWVGAHTAADPMSGVFLLHSVLATVKWAIVPWYLGHTALLVYRGIRDLRAGDTPAPVPALAR
jgi:hypothetical protein